MFWLSGTADRIVWAVSSKEIFGKDPSSGFSVSRSIDSIWSEIDQKWNILSLSTSKTFPKSMAKEINTIKANTMVLDKKVFFNGFHSLENIFLLWNNLNVLKFKDNH